jgi:hypothetical protein
LLLLSKSKRFPAGLANSNGLVGKYLMWDNGGEAQGLFEHPFDGSTLCTPLDVMEFQGPIAPN